MIDQGNRNKLHTIEIDDLVLSPEDGLLLGNGDLSVSIYQKQDKIIWRFGKGDVWDRRHVTEDNPKALTMDELRHGINMEGWTCPAFGGRKEALRGTKDPKRMIDVLDNPPSQSYPYPTPKPVGELSLRWPPDLQRLKIKQTLVIEESMVLIDCSWPDGEKLHVECFIHPEINVLVVNWKLTGWHSGSPQPFFKESPVLLSLYRWADPTIAEFTADYIAKYNYHGFDGYCNSKATSLPAPEIVKQDGKYIIEQKFHPEKTFPGGFKYWLGCLTDQPSIECAQTKALKEARLFISSSSSTSHEDMADIMKIDTQLRDGTLHYPPQQDYQGTMVVPVTTSSDQDGVEGNYKAIVSCLGDDLSATINRWKSENIESARKFWSASSISLAEKTIENLWYHTLHVSRSVYRKGTVPPGLYLPSTVPDYAMWHGDYHMNYNIQQPFWGFHAANHPELTEAYYTIMGYAHGIGKKIASDYCSTRGSFIQIGIYPIEFEDDPMPTSPMGRMTYMTGWVVELFWQHYRYTGDIKFLRERAYPFIKDCALFYTDYLQLGDDGLYHAFPSCWGEEGYDGTVETNTDAMQTMDYAFSCMQTALRAAKTLGVDEDFQDAWQQRIDSLAPGRGECEWRPLPGTDEDYQKEFNYPNFKPGENYRFPNKWSLAQRWWGWADKLTISWIRDVRGGQFDVEKDFDDLVKVINRWRHANGIIWAMPLRFYGQAGMWSEILGIIAPIQEMLLQSWDDVIRVFPCWPKKIQASFNDLRVQGGFLVSANCEDGLVKEILIKSLLGGTCTVANPWRSQKIQVLNDKRKVTAECAAGRVEFETIGGQEYIIVP